MKTLDAQHSELKARIERLRQQGRRVGLLELQLRELTHRILRRDLRKQKRAA